MEDLHRGGQIWNLPVEPEEGDDSGSKKYRRGCGGVWRRQRLQKKVTTLVARNTDKAVVGFVRRQRLQKKVTTLVARNTDEAVVGFGWSME
jgi:hypothetical protein